MASRRPARWTHPSVLKFAGNRDPIEAITERARSVVLSALDAGWQGPPFDPVVLAEILKLRVVGRDDVRDARIVPVGNSGLQIEFNPNRPPARVRYSVAHEIAHTLFDDCGEQIRNRASRSEMMDDEWQLEVLCNIAAAEFLMPIGTLPRLHGEALSIANLMDLRKHFQVSAEALLIRVARLADEACVAFCASPIETGCTTGRYRLDYLIPSEMWAGQLPRATVLPAESRVRECTAIGFTAKGTERWPGTAGEVYLECVGISPYPGSSVPRVVGILRGTDVDTREESITYLAGDALQPRGEGPHIIAHVVNDGTPKWGGGGFAAAVRRRWPKVQEDFIKWVAADRSRLRLGNVHMSTISDELIIVHMIAQRGFGASSQPRIRYAPLRAGLARVASLARELGASVHMPRIGAGQGGGEWSRVEELIIETLCSTGVAVFVYDLPGRPVFVSQQPSLDLPIN